MDPAVDSVDDKIVVVAVLVGESAVDDAPDDLLARPVVDAAINADTVELPCRQLALHGADDVAALAHARPGGARHP